MAGQYFSWRKTVPKGKFLQETAQNVTGDLASHGMMPLHVGICFVMDFTRRQRTSTRSTEFLTYFPKDISLSALVEHHDCWSSTQKLPLGKVNPLGSKFLTNGRRGLRVKREVCHTPCVLGLSPGVNIGSTVCLTEFRSLNQGESSRVSMLNVSSDMSALCEEMADGFGSTKKLLSLQPRLNFLTG
jgi:hypothetical protein